MGSRGMRMARRWFPRCHKSPTPVAFCAVVTQCFVAHLSGSIVTCRVAKTESYHHSVRSEADTHSPTTIFFSCKLTLLMIRCDHEDPFPTFFDPHCRHFEWGKQSAVERKEHHWVPGHHLHHARRLPYAQLWHPRPRVHSNKEVRIYDQVTQCWNITKKVSFFCTVCERCFQGARIWFWYAKVHPFNSVKCDFFGRFSNTVSKWPPSQRIWSETLCRFFFQGYKKPVHALRAVGGGSACGMHHW